MHEQVLIQGDKTDINQGKEGLLVLPGRNRQRLDAIYVILPKLPSDRLHYSFKDILCCKYELKKEYKDQH